MVYTDHQALKTAFTWRDVHGRIARWMALVSEYTFEVRHTPGRLNGPADYLSRAGQGVTDDVKCDGDWMCKSTLVVGSTEAEMTSGSMEMGLEDVKSYLDDLDVTAASNTTRARLRLYAISKVTLMRRTAQGMRVVPPIEMRHRILARGHDCNGHWDTKGMASMVGISFWWPTLSRDARLYVRSCDECQKTKPAEAWVAGMRQPVSGLFYTGSMDFVGPLPETRRENACILLAVEHLNGYPGRWLRRIRRARRQLISSRNSLLACFGRCGQW